MLRFFWYFFYVCFVWISLSLFSLFRIFLTDRKFFTFKHRSLRLCSIFLSILVCFLFISQPLSLSLSLILYFLLSPSLPLLFSFALYPTLLRDESHILMQLSKKTYALKHAFFSFGCVIIITLFSAFLVRSSFCSLSLSLSLSLSSFLDFTIVLKNEELLHNSFSSRNRSSKNLSFSLVHTHFNTFSLSLMSPPLECWERERERERETQKRTFRLLDCYFVRR